MPYKLPVEIRAIVLKQFPDLTPIQKDKICNCVSSNTEGILRQFIQGFAIEEADIDRVQLKDASPDYDRAFKAGAKWGISQINAHVMKTLTQMGIEPVK